RAAARLTGSVQEGSLSSLDLETVNGTVVFDGLAVRYLPALPPATKVAGTGKFSERSLGLHVARGDFAGLKLERARVDVPSGSGPPPQMAIDASLRGPLAKAFALLAQEPSIGLTHVFGVTPADVAGAAEGRIRLALPLSGGVDLRATRPAVTATLR